MQKSSSKAYGMSILLHGAVLLVLALLLKAQRAPVEVDHVFTLVEAPNVEQTVNSAVPDTPDTPSTPEPTVPTQAIGLPSIAPVRPAPDQVAQPRTAAPAQPTRETAPTKPPPPPDPAPQRITQEEFIRSHGAPRQTTPRPAPQRKITAPQIDVSQVRRELAQINRAQSSGAPQVSSDDLARWRDAVYAQIDRSWQEPGDLAGHDFSTVIRFDVAADGAIRNVTVIRSSGNRAFDDSVLSALRRVGRVQAPPGRVAFTPTLTFQKRTL